MKKNKQKIIKGNFVINEINFGSFLGDGGNQVEVKGELKLKLITHKFRMVISLLESGDWKFHEMGWRPKAPNIENKLDVIKPILDKSAQVLKTTNMWSGEQFDKSAEIIMNQIKVPKNAESTNAISFRAAILNLKNSNWNSMWGLIDNRVKHDSFFKVHGFSKEEIILAIDFLRKIFPSDWVKSKYKKGGVLHLGDDFPPESKDWFPAYHFARTANGSICIDPGWNYLIEIGLSISELQSFPELKRLLNELVRSPGTRHHLCLAAELFKRGYLVGLEPMTGSGSATNDLLVKINKSGYGIEVKEFSSKYPIKVLKKELLDKAGKLPNKLTHPTIFHIVLIEDGNPDPKREQDFLDSLDSLINEIPVKISAVVVGTRFVDASGGRIKRDLGKIVINPHAILPVDNSDLEELFKRNYTECLYPIHSIGTFFYFGNS